ncbi:2-hydroxyacid dehydrogenase [Actinoplanes sp. RD1]|uniref:2-hydroxyacid dehydrogenase n=1 Tax=Actinoplanes sp. RD1 TaxID=3064538 RepID=UPI0027426267|nr:2-hydroxyacid dehydrogenase [Actinoplanes sp. RD1]
MPRPQLLLLSRQGHASLRPAHWERLSELADVRAVAMNGAPGPAEAAAMLASMDLLGATNVCLPRLDDELLDRAPRLRGVVLYATGHDHIDTDLLARRGVGLSVLPDYATISVAEQTIALILSLATRLHLANDRARGRVEPGVSLRGVELAGRTLGVVGLGRIGRAVADRGRMLGMRVVGTDLDPAAAARAGISVLDLRELLRTADVVALCASHRYGSGPVIGAAELAVMQPGSYLVNAARAALVDTGAAVAALRTGRLRGYGVDDDLNDPAYDDVAREGRLLQTGHSAWWRDETMRKGAEAWGRHLIAAVQGAPIDVVTWPEPAVSGAG